jgi:hypothetical protein
VSVLDLKPRRCCASSRRGAGRSSVVRIRWMMIRMPVDVNPAVCTMSLYR